MKSYYLIPRGTVSQKSFYCKARVDIDDNGVETLYSYNTPVLKRNPDGEYRRIKTPWNDSTGWSATTGRHVYSFCYQYGDVVGKKEWERIPFERKEGEKK